MADCNKYRPCVDADQKILLAVPGIQQSVHDVLKFGPECSPIDILGEAVCTMPDGSLKYLVMGGYRKIEDDEDNREGYWYISNNQITKSVAIVRPVLS